METRDIPMCAHDSWMLGVISGITSLIVGGIYLLFG